MININLWRQFFSIVLFASTLNGDFFAEADNAHGWEPSVSLSADLDEPQQFGFCIDFTGAGASLSCNGLQARSCKRLPGDTQFEYYLPTKAIRSVNYNSDCDASSEPSTRGCIRVSDNDEFESGATLGVGSCDESDDRQIFELFEIGENYELRVGGDLCLAVSDTSVSPGEGAPPLARKRDLTVTTCSTLPEEQKTWTIKPKPNENTQTNSPTAAPLFSFNGTPPFLFVFFNFFWDPIRNNLFSGWLNFMV